MLTEVSTSPAARSLHVFVPASDTSAACRFRALVPAILLCSAAAGIVYLAQRPTGAHDLRSGIHGGRSDTDSEVSFISKPPAHNFDVWYINTPDGVERNRCMQKQLRHAHLKARRYSADVFGHCSGGASSLAKCLEQQGFGDCVQGGIDWSAVSSHGDDTHASVEVSSHIISNYCSHKRLFSKIAMSGNASEFALVFEDDVLLDTDALVLEIDSFLEAYRDIDWDLVVVDPMNIQVDFVYQGRLKGGMCDRYETGRHRGRPVWRVPQVKAGQYGPCLFEECSFCGAQALLVRTASIKRLVAVMEAQPAVPMDWLPRHVPGSLAWRPEVALNPRGSGRGPPEVCGMQAESSSIDGKAEEGVAEPSAPISP